MNVLLLMLLFFLTCEAMAPAIKPASNPCAAVMCKQGTICVSAPKQCIKAPCDQFECQPILSSVERLTRV
ncbi:hypothetical protein L596_013810 [Steinernema carpocapsae]|uniref:Uncharacterized protein n=1 Tax=Steinernema carpocapsae TaxID=34508 RepID=A0A4U5P199_STECR|nr:hypothetical protein L596_013810 [Steinernema carpocapsae]